MAVKEGSSNDQDNTLLSADINPRLGVTTSQFVLIDDKDVTRDEMKDDLYKAVKSGNTIKVGELTGQGPDVKRPDPSGVTALESETEKNHDRRDLQEQKRHLLDEFNQFVLNGKRSPAKKQPNDILAAENPLDTMIAGTINRGPELDVEAADAEEAALQGDYTALARLRFANKAREENEHTDVDGDGYVAKSMSDTGEFGATFGRPDEYGGYYQGDDYYDRFGGHYDGYGYEAEDGSYTNSCGEHWDKETGQITNSDGTARVQTSKTVEEAVKKEPDLGKTITIIDAQVVQDRLGTKPGQKFDKRAAGKKAGGGLIKTDTATPKDQEITNIVVETRLLSGQNPRGPSTAAERKAAAEKYDRIHGFVNKEGEALKALKANNGVVPAATAKPGAPETTLGKDNRWKPVFTALSKEEATAKIGHIHLPAAAQTTPAATTASVDTVAPKKDAAGGADTKTTPAADTAPAADDDAWYADGKGGYWDDLGGYYDKNGGYWDADGGYWDKYNVYTDKDGGRTWPDGSYLDPNFNYVDKNGVYVMEDGTEIKPPAGMDFKKQMQDAAAKHETWQMPQELVPLLKASALPDLPLTTLPTVTPLSPVPLPVVADAKPEVKIEPLPKLDSNILKVDPVSLTVPAAKLDTTSILSPTAGIGTTAPDFKIDTSRFTPACTASSGHNDFSSFFNNYHSYLSAPKQAGETKFFDLSNVTLASTVTTPLLPGQGDAKSLTIPSPKALA